MVAASEKLLVTVCPGCGEPDLLPFAVDGLVGRCNACGGTFVIQGEIVAVGYCCELDPVTGLRPAPAPKPAAAKHDHPAPHTATAPSEEPAPAPQPAVVAKAPQQPQTSRKRRAAVYASAAAIIVVALIMGRGIVATSDS